MLYPLPAVLVSCGTPDGRYNLMTAAWTGTVCSDPPMLYVSIRKERFSHRIIKETGEFFVNLTTRDLAFATDWCGVKSGRQEDKFARMHLTPQMGALRYAPMVAESPVSIECKVTEVVPLGTHDMFIADIVAVNIDERYIDEKGKFHPEKCAFAAYAHGQYFALGKKIGSFGYSVKKKKK